LSVAGHGDRTDNALVDDTHPLAYWPFTYQEYYEHFWKMGL
jgi:hypothetical protein